MNGCASVSQLCPFCQLIFQTVLVLTGQSTGQGNMAEKYNEQQLITACNLIKEGQLTYGQAFRKFGIPKSTLFKKCKETLVNIKKRGPQTRERDSS